MVGTFCSPIVETLDETQEVLAGEVYVLSTINVVAATGVDNSSFWD